MVLILINLFERPFFQLVFLTLLSFLNLGYVLVNKPYPTDQENKIQIYCESMVYSTIWMSVIYLIEIDKDILSNTGWIQICVATSIIVVSIGFLIKDGVFNAINAAG
jgi:hypothetical protein